ncbi:restriction endonuclease subunit S [Vibrio atlanticus]|uniref:EcoKI restriction-modification system protein HsdS n=1 Tax=Vibrio atlanticus TaxID=693153 RepID=A0A1C3IL67_9VIBR|nr:restriction endonuclease subunit S [Vibrio atlanticus]SBS62163.1 EcoKI restriction-modification system protein HsdS [Vibrio atlanticus]
MSSKNIPNGWRVCKQSQVSTFHNGRAYKKTEWEESGTPVIRLQNLTGSGDSYYYSTLELPEHQNVNNGELLYMWSATFGPSIWRGEKAIYHYHIWKVDCHKDLLDKMFMFFHLDYVTESMKSKTNGSTMLHLTKKGMEDNEILLPPLKEQQKIAEVLSTADQKIDLIDQKIAETKKLKTGLMQKLFTEGVGVQDENGEWQPHASFKDSPLGTTIPSIWKVKQQQKVATFYNGRAYKRTEWEESGTPVIRLQNLTGSGDKYYYSNMQLPEHQYVNKGELLFMWSATFGPKVWGGDKAIYHYHIWKVACNESLLGKSYMFYSLLYMTEKMKKQTNGSTMLHFTKKGMEEQLMVIPPISEQNQIAEILGTVDQKLNSLKLQKLETEQLKKGLMQKLLTGEWRVPLDNH